jgi:anion-transporting  ArsA/GET3 family ATPase
MLNISGMNESFRERAQQTRALLESDSTAFVLVTGPMPERLDEALYFYELLLQHRLRVAAVVVNRVHSPPAPGMWEQLAPLPPALRAKFEQTLKEHEQLARQDALGVERLRRAVGQTPVILVPRFEVDVHDLAGLYETSRWLWGDVRFDEAGARRLAGLSK